MKAGRLLLLFASLLFVTACTSTRPFVADKFEGWESVEAPEDTELAYRVFLIGDAGGADESGTTPALKLLRKQLLQAGEDAAVVFLGDNLYCCGLPDSANSKRKDAEQQLIAQLEAVKEFDGRIVFLPGNHDWNHSRRGGLETLARQEAFVEEYLGKNVFRPDDGFPGPDVIKLTDRARLVVIDTEWWLTRYERGEGEYDDFDIEEEGDFLVALNEVISDHRKEDLLIVGHHPIFSNGEHAGRYPLKTHIFPLTELAPNAYIPLPILGSLYPIFIRNIGGRQDLAHRDYKALRNALIRIFGEHESLIYAAGHEHNLQYFQDLHHNYIVSGSGSKVTPVASGGQAGFTYATQGYSTLNYYKDGSIWMSMWAVSEDKPDGEVVFRTEIKGPARDIIDPEVPEDGTITYPDYSDSTYVIAANPNYKAGGFYEFMLGRHNREIWALPVEVPYLDMGKEAGGLTPVKRGGGMQTFSLRLRGEDGFEYVIRSIDKDPSVSVPEELRESFVTAVVQDQIASIHPYGAFIIPKLASAAGVYHTTPRLVYVPDDPRLGIYREKFGGQLMMFEIRPSDDMSDKKEFGNSEDVVSAHSFYEEITSDNDNRLDTEAFVKARLFDMLLSDWDRHQLQWRWAEFDADDDNGKVYRPVPRDRDWAFNKFDGVMPSLVRISFDPKFQEFDEDFGNLKGLTKNGHWQDRRLTAPVSRETWIEKAAELQASLTDDVIDRAVLDWPESVVEYHGADVAATLKVRRDQLVDVAETYYEILAKYVDIVATNKHERFEVNRLSDNETELVVYKTSKKGEIRKELIRRTFYTDETKEIRLFGLDGNDQFEISGRAATGILVRVVGGAGDDEFTDHSHTLNGGIRAIYYDTNDNNMATAGPNSKINFSSDPNVNAYNQKDYLHDATLPQLFFGRNQDDGIFVGGGLKFVKHGFRKKPFDRSQTIVGNFAALTQAYNIVYEGHFTEALGSADLMVEASYRSPNNFRNFFGLGNETENTAEEAEFYQSQLSTALLQPMVHLSGELGTAISLGPVVRYINVRNEDDNFIGQQGISASSFRDQWFFGLVGDLTLDFSDHPVNPKRGFVWENTSEINFGIANSDDVYAQLRSALALYASPSLSPQVTLALRAGSAHNIGDFPFYAANTVGGRRTVRGWRSNRFAGRTSFYTNAELRAKLLNVNSYVATGEFGLLLFFDNGRVWTEEDAVTGRVWHQGYGGGLWMSLFNAIVVNGTLGFSEEGEVFNLRLGFLY